MSETVTVTQTEAPAAAPVAQAVAAVEILTAAHEAGVAEGVSEGLSLAGDVAMAERVNTLEMRVQEQAGMIATGASMLSDLSAQVAALGTSQAIVEEAVIAAIVEEPETESVETEEAEEPAPVVDNTPKRRRKWA